MDEKVPELLDLTKKLLDLARDIFKASLVPHESLELKEIQYSIFLRVEMQEALRFGYGAYYSCYHGWAHGGIGAARSIYEIFLDIRYINDDKAEKNERFERFMDHLAEDRYHQMERNLKIGKNISREKQCWIKNEYEQLKKKYNNKYKQDINSGVAKTNPTPKYRRYNWAGLDLKEKTDAINLEKFHQLYKNLSDLSHISVRSVLEVTKSNTEDQIDVHLNFNPSLIHCSFVLNVVFPCILGILGEYMEYFRIEHSCYPTLERILEERAELEKQKSDA